MKLNNDDTGQMLLATGVVLMMSLSQWQYSA